MGNSKIIKSFSYFLFLIPILANVADGLGLIKHFPDRFITIYFVALFFTIGNTIFYLYCPNLISKYLTFKDYTSVDRSYKTLLYEILEMVEHKRFFISKNLSKDSEKVKDRKNDGEEFRHKFLYDFMMEFGVGQTKDQEVLIKKGTKKQFLNMEYDISMLQPAFVKASQRATKLDFTKRLLCQLFYLFGFLCIAFMIVQNTISVISKY